MHFLVGDVQGCCDALDRLLADIGFSPSRDTIHVLGDLVNRGPKSLVTLQRLAGYGDAAQCLLGNHDLSLLATAAGVRRVHRRDTIADILDSPQRAQWLDWLAHRRMAAMAQGWLLVHAGVPPQWSAERTLACAAEVEAALRGPGRGDFLAGLFGDEPDRWSDSLRGQNRLRFVVNALTRMRFVDDRGTLEFKTKEGTGAAAAGFMPWFDHPERATRGQPVAFGHWSTLGAIDRPDLLALDTGCVWGGRLSAVRVDGGRREWFQIGCEQAQEPG